MSRGWVSEARTAGRLNSEKMPFEIMIPNERQQRHGFPSEAEAVEAAKAAMAESGDSLPFVLVYKGPNVIARVVPDVVLQVGEAIPIQNTALMGVVQYRQDDGAYVIALAATVMRDERGQPIVIADPDHVA